MLSWASTLRGHKEKIMKSFEVRDHFLVSLLISDALGNSENIFWTS